MKNKYSLGQYPNSDVSRIKEDIAKLQQIQHIENWCSESE